MDQAIEQALVEIYKNSFINTYEAGGGYGYRYHHGYRVMTYCKRFLDLDYFKSQDINREAVIVAALFHDIGKVKAIDGSGEIIYGSKGDLEHTEVGGQIVGDYIKEYVTDEATLTLISEIIKESDEGGQSSLESKLVKDADRFDNYGFIQVWRHMTFVQHDHDSGNILRLKEYWVDKNAREEAKKYLDHFNFPFIREMATRRFDKIDFLISEIDHEVNGDDITN